MTILRLLDALVPTETTSCAKLMQPTHELEVSDGFVATNDISPAKVVMKDRKSH